MLSLAFGFELAVPEFVLELLVVLVPLVELEPFVELPELEVELELPVELLLLEEFDSLSPLVPVEVPLLFDALEVLLEFELVVPFCSVVELAVPLCSVADAFWLLCSCCAPF